MWYLQVSMFVFRGVKILFEATPDPTKVESKGLSWEALLKIAQSWW